MGGDTTSRKLQKKQVHFTSSTTGESDALTTLNPPLTPTEGNLPSESKTYSSYFPEYEPVLQSVVTYEPPTPDPTPPGDEKKPKGKTSWLPKLRLTNADTEPPYPAAPTRLQPFQQLMQWVAWPLRIMIGTTTRLITRNTSRSFRPLIRKIRQ